MTLKQFLKDWTLPVAMLAGAGGYFLFHYAGFLSPMKPAVWTAVEILTPSLIFIQLFLTFCKIDFKDLRISRWHWIILAFQMLSALVMAGVLILVPMDETYREIFEGAMVCLICPTATAAAVVTDKLGGSAARITVYNLMSNILAAAFVPLVFPLVEVHQDAGFLSSFLKILSKVFPLLICPFLLAVLLSRRLTGQLTDLTRTVSRCPVPRAGGDYPGLPPLPRRCCWASASRPCAPRSSVWPSTACPRPSALSAPPCWPVSNRWKALPWRPPATAIPPGSTRSSVNTSL